jgi:hypothetical protein
MRRLDGGIAADQHVSMAIQQMGSNSITAACCADLLNGRFGEKSFATVPAAHDPTDRPFIDVTRANLIVTHAGNVRLQKLWLTTLARSTTFAERESKSWLPFTITKQV